MSVYNRVDKIFDKFWDKHYSADFHGIDMELLREPLEKLAKNIDKKLAEIKDEAGDCQGRSGQYISDLCKI